MRILIVCDAHYGSPFSSSLSIYKFLEDVESEYSSVKRIIACGDMFELIYNTKEKVFSKYSSDKELLTDSSSIYIVGNHDMCLIDEFENSVFEYSLKNKKFIHGYQLEFRRKEDSKLRKFEKICYKITKSNNRCKKFIYTSKLKLLFPYVKGHMSSFKRKFEITKGTSNTVFGHFHSQISIDESFCLNSLTNNYCYILKKKKIVPINLEKVVS